jgi:uncharacterized membrane protein
MSSETALKASARFWFATTLIGQLIFGFAVLSFYGLTAARGDFHRWARFVTGGRIAGDSMGNVAVAMHIASAAVIMLAGAVQLIPGLRNRFPRFHRWNGRIYMLTALTLSVAGVYMTWFRKTVGDVPQHLGSTLNAILIWLCAAMALRYAIGRDFRAHRVWALRLFLVVSASWTLRISFFLILAIFGPVGFDPATFSGPFLTFMAYAQYLVPLAILELYLYAQQRGTGAFLRSATAALLSLLTIGMIAGIGIVSMSIWVPEVKAGFDTRQPIGEMLADTIKSRGIEPAIAQYRALKATKAAVYNFDESELNTLGYQFLRNKHYDEAIRILQLNTEAYPKSGNVWDSLGEAYMNAGNTPLAIVNYRKSVELNPKNYVAAAILKKLGAQNFSPRASSRAAR